MLKCYNKHYNNVFRIYSISYTLLTIIIFNRSELVLQARMQKQDIEREEDGYVFTMSKITDLGLKVR